MIPPLDGFVRLETTEHVKLRPWSNLGETRVNSKLETPKAQSRLADDSHNLDGRFLHIRKNMEDLGSKTWQRDLVPNIPMPFKNPSYLAEL